MGTVAGQLAAPTPGQSMAGLIVYLGGLLPLQPGTDYLVSVSPEQSPKTQVDAKNRFLFTSVLPGKYAIVLWTPHRSELVPDPSTPGKELLVTVVADQVLDLGVLASRPPD